MPDSGTCASYGVAARYCVQRWRHAADDIPRADLESLHHMECSNTVCHETPIPDQILSEARKLSRYYIYLLFCHFMSSAGPKTYNQQGFMFNRLIRMSQWEPKKNAAPLVDVPESWLETKVCTNYPSAPPTPKGNFMSGFPPYFPRSRLSINLRRISCIHSSSNSLSVSHRSRFESIIERLTTPSSRINCSHFKATPNSYIQI